VHAWFYNRLDGIILFLRNFFKDDQYAVKKNAL